MFWFEVWGVLAFSCFFVIAAMVYAAWASKLPKWLDVRGLWVRRSELQRFGVVLAGASLLGIGLVQHVIAMQRTASQASGVIESVAKSQVGMGRYNDRLEDVYAITIRTDDGAQILAPGMDDDGIQPFLGEKVWVMYEPWSDTVQTARFYSDSGRWIDTYDIDRSRANSKRWFWGLKRSHFNGLMLVGAGTIFFGLFGSRQRTVSAF